MGNQTVNNTNYMNRYMCMTRALNFQSIIAAGDRGREDRVVPVPPPSEPDRRVSRIRLSSRWSYLEED